MLSTGCCMSLLRMLGGGLLIAAIITFAHDVLSPRSGQVDDFRFSTFSDVWITTGLPGPDAVEPAVRTHIHPTVWDWIIQPLLPMPASPLLGLLGFVLLIKARKGRLVTPPSDTSERDEPTPRIQARAGSRSARSELAAALLSCRGGLVGVGLFCAMSNVLMLTGAFFMLEVYDRVLPSRSMPTLIGLVVLAGILFSAQGVLDWIRGRLLVRIAAVFDESLSARIYDTIVRLPLRTSGRGDGLLPLRDLDSVRAFLSGVGPAALFDLPWVPLYLGIIFAFHPLLGVAALSGAVVLLVLTLLTEFLTRAPTRAATEHAIVRNGLAESSRRNAEVLTAMGMSGRIGQRWSEANHGFMASQQLINNVAGGFGATARVLRMMLQSGVLAIGAYLVLQQQASAGIIIAGAILAARALAPVDVAIANGKAFVAARQSWKRLKELLALLPAHASPMPLPSPKSSVLVSSVSVVPPGEQRRVVSEVRFALKGGQGLGVIGPSGSGKSSLMRVLVGAWQPAHGRIQLDGAALDQWSPEDRGRHIGYLPQHVELLPGTIGENIARFEPDVDPAAIVTAAQAAGVHGLIVDLPAGYETRIAEHGASLSAGQLQRIALARALYREPFLVVLDEPNSNLDGEGEAALTQAILDVRARGGVVVVVAHRPSALAGVDLVLAMQQGRAIVFGPKDEVLSKLQGRDPQPTAPLRVVAETGRASS